MLSFLCNTRPRSVNAQNTHRYKDAIARAFNEYYPHQENMLEGELYGIVYYFHSRPTEIDADNLSKPVWDALESIAYKNDKIIKIRYAGVIDLNSPGTITTLNIKNFPEKVLNSFLNLVDRSVDHIIYIEIGKIKPSLYAIGVE